MQGLLEGLKAYRKGDGKILLFQPKENALRLKIGAERMCMPSPTVEQFMEAVKLTVLANERWVLCCFSILVKFAPLVMVMFDWLFFFTSFRFLHQVKVHYI